MNAPQISVIVRFRDEAQYLEAVLRALRAQDFPSEPEILAIDNHSQDGSDDIAKRFADRVFSIDDYRPGRALNEAVERARAPFIAVLSGHAIPCNSQWLTNLYSHLHLAKLAGVYGGQLYNINSRFLDKRDLDIFSSFIPRIEVENSDFWNANSMFPRHVWEQQQFDETVYELEDHYWTKQLLPQGYRVHFEPRSLVYHYSHIARLDREFLPPCSDTTEKMISSAIAELRHTNEWPRVMAAGLTLSSLTKHPSIITAVPALVRHLLSHWDFDVRWRMAQALGKIPSADSAHGLALALSDSSFYVRDEAAWSLARLGSLGAQAVFACERQLSCEFRQFAALALGLSRCPKAEARGIEILAEGLASKNPTERLNAAYFCGELAGVPGACALIRGLDAMLEADPDSSHVACWARGCFSAFDSADRVWDKIPEIAEAHPNALARFEAVVAIGKRAMATCDSSLVDLVSERCQDRDDRVRYGAVQSLRLLCEAGAEITPPLELEDDRDYGVRFELNLLRKHSRACSLNN